MRAQFGVHWMGSRNFLAVGSFEDQPIFDTLWSRLVLVDAIRVEVRHGRPVPVEVWERLAHYETLIAQRNAAAAG